LTEERVGEELGKERPREKKPCARQRQTRREEKEFRKDLRKGKRRTADKEDRQTQQKVARRELGRSLTDLFQGGRGNERRGPIREEREEGTQKRAADWADSEEHPGTPNRKKKRDFKGVNKTQVKGGKKTRIQETERKHRKTQEVSEGGWGTRKGRGKRVRGECLLRKENCLKGAKGDLRQTYRGLTSRGKRGKGKDIRARREKRKSEKWKIGHERVLWDFGKEFKVRSQETKERERSVAKKTANATAAELLNQDC